MNRDELREVLRVLERNTYAAMQEARGLLERAAERMDRAGDAEAFAPEEHGPA